MLTRDGFFGILCKVVLVTALKHAEYIKMPSTPRSLCTMPGSFIFTMRLMHSAYANHKRKVMVIYDISFWMGGRYDCIQLYILYTAQMKLKTKHIHNFSTQTSNDPLEIVRQMAWIYP